MLEFIWNLKKTTASFVYAVIPRGASIGSAGAFLKSELKKLRLELQRVDPLVVPDSARIFYDIDSPENLSNSWIQLQISLLPSRSRLIVWKEMTLREVQQLGKLCLQRIM